MQAVTLVLVAPSCAAANSGYFVRRARGITTCLGLQTFFGGGKLWGSGRIPRNIPMWKLIWQWKITVLVVVPYLGGGNSNIFSFHPEPCGIWKWSNLTLTNAFSHGLNISDEWKGIVIIYIYTHVVSNDNSTYQVLQSDLAWTHTWPFQGLSDLHFGNQSGSLWRSWCYCVFLWKHSECFQSATMSSSLQRGVLFVAVAIFSQATFDTISRVKTWKWGNRVLFVLLVWMWDWSFRPFKQALRLFQKFPVLVETSFQIWTCHLDEKWRQKNWFLNQLQLTSSQKWHPLTAHDVKLSLTSVELHGKYSYPPCEWKPLKTWCLERQAFPFGTRHIVEGISYF